MSYRTGGLLNNPMYHIIGAITRAGRYNVPIISYIVLIVRNSNKVVR